MTSNTGEIQESPRQLLRVRLCSVSRTRQPECVFFFFLFSALICHHFLHFSSSFFFLASPVLSRTASLTSTPVLVYYSGPPEELTGSLGSARLQASTAYQTRHQPPGNAARGHRRRLAEAQINKAWPLKPTKPVQSPRRTRRQAP